MALDRPVQLSPTWERDQNKRRKRIAREQLNDTMEEGDWRMLMWWPQASRRREREEWRTNSLCLHDAGCWIAHSSRISSAASSTTRTAAPYDPIVLIFAASSSSLDSMPSVVFCCVYFTACTGQMSRRNGEYLSPITPRIPWHDPNHR